MKKSIWKLAALFAAVLALSLCFAGCSDDDDDDDGGSSSDSGFSSKDDIVGTWTGNVTIDNITYAFSLTFGESTVSTSNSRYYEGTGTGTVTVDGTAENVRAEYTVDSNTDDEAHPERINLYKTDDDDNEIDFQFNYSSGKSENPSCSSTQMTLLAMIVDGSSYDSYTGKMITFTKSN